MQIKAFFDKLTSTLTYIVWDEQTQDAVLIDPVLDYDPDSGKIWQASIALLLNFIKENQLKVHWILETHVHADHLTGAQVLKKELGARIAIGEHIQKVQSIFAPLFNMDCATDGSQFDHLLKNGEEFQAGRLHLQALHTPGHTPACVSYRIGDAVFTGDALFMPDGGVGRCDFPAGSATALYQSVHQGLYQLPEETRVFVGHDYQPDGRPLRWETTIGESKRQNCHLREESTEAAFVTFRSNRDAILKAPRLLLPSIQVNIEAGRLPDPQNNGRRYLKIPLTEV